MVITATYKIAHAAGQDAGNASMRIHGRTTWDTDDWNAAAKVMNHLLRK